MQDTYSHLRRSTLVDGLSSQLKDSTEEGVRLRASMGFDGSDTREVTLLQSGLIVERVDIRRQEREERERRKAEERAGRRRKTSRTSLATFMSDASSIHSISNPLQNVNYGNRSQISLSPTTATASKRLSSPLAQYQGRPDMNRMQSSSSSEAAPPIPRFFGYRHWKGAYGSEASLHNNSGSMIALQYVMLFGFVLSSSHWWFYSLVVWVWNPIMAYTNALTMKRNGGLVQLSMSLHRRHRRLRMRLSKPRGVVLDDCGRR